MGQCFLGRDRAFRCYYYLHNFSMFFIEKPKLEDVIESCGEPTPLASVSNVCISNFFLIKFDYKF